MSAEIFLKGRVQLCCGDSLHFLRDQPDGRYDSVVTDPPYALAFMGKRWDTAETAFAVEFWAEVLRILKPGGHVVAFSGTRTYHRLACAIEDAGFEIRDQLAWTYGTGFNKKGYILRDAANVPIGPWGGALKPAWEPICLARKALIGTVATNLEVHGTGAINIDGCRIGTSDVLAIGAGVLGYHGADGSNPGAQHPSGRWPANIIHDGSDEVIAAFPESNDSHINGSVINARASIGYGGSDVEFRTVRHAGDGSAARFFYTAKADSDDRLGSKHPTVKPVDLMQWLVRLVTPKGGIVLDPFAGTGTTAEACYREGMRCMLVERETEYQSDIRRRMALVLAGPDERSRESIKAKTNGHPIDHGPLFSQSL